MKLASDEIARQEIQRADRLFIARRRNRIGVFVVAYFLVIAAGAAFPAGLTSDPRGAYLLLAIGLITAIALPVLFRFQDRAKEINVKLDNAIETLARARAMSLEDKSEKSSTKLDETFHEISARRYSDAFGRTNHALYSNAADTQKSKA